MLELKPKAPAAPAMFNLSPRRGAQHPKDGNGRDDGFVVDVLYEQLQIDTAGDRAARRRTDLGRILGQQDRSENAAASQAMLHCNIHMRAAGLSGAETLMRHDTYADTLTSVDFAPNPGNLRMRVHAPRDLGPGSGLVVVLHGCTQSAAGYAENAGWIELADRFGFALLCPEQKRENNPNLCFNWFRREDIAREAGEAASIAAMVRDAVRRYEIDPSRVFVSGLSAGGAMAGAMAAAYPDLFSGAALIAGLPYGVAANVQDALAVMKGERSENGRVLGDRVRASGAETGAWPTIAVWQGQADAVVSPSAGEAVARQWRDVHQTQGLPKRARTPDGREFELWLNRSGAPVVEVHRIRNLAHGTPLKVTGSTGCGSVAPHLFDVGISSSFESALSWGLIDPARLDEHVRVEPIQADTAESRRPRTAPSAHGVQDVIEDALRRAGLMG